jgi:hypothetical protein
MSFHSKGRRSVAQNRQHPCLLPFGPDGSDLACPPAGRIAFRHRRTRYCHETWKGYVVNSDIVGPAGDINKAIDGNGGCCAGEVVACGKVVPDEVRLTLKLQAMMRVREALRKDL